MSREKRCICSDCGEVHSYEPIAVSQISDIDRIRLFRKTVLEAKYITGQVPIPNGAQVGVPYHLNDPAALAIRYLHVALYRKYFANRHDKVFLPELAVSIKAILGQMAPVNLVARVRADIKALKQLEFSGPAQLFLGEQVSNISAADVVFDNLYGHLLHADQARVERAHNLGPIVSTFAAQAWLVNAVALVNRLDRVVEYVLELEKIGFDFTDQSGTCPDY